MFGFNEGLDEAVLEPVATVYADVVPSPVRTGVSNASANIADVWSLVNNLLQFQWEGAYNSLVRVTVNTVLGFGGLLDIATEAGVTRHKQDFGLTLARWRVPSGPYFVIPFFGPSSVRDGVGLVADWTASPVTRGDSACAHAQLALRPVGRGQARRAAAGRRNARIHGAGQIQLHA